MLYVIGDGSLANELGEYYGCNYCLVGPRGHISDDELVSRMSYEDWAIVGVGDPALRDKLFLRFRDVIRFDALHHIKAWIAQHALVAQTSVIAPFVSVNQNVIIRDNVCILTNAIIGHCSSIGRSTLVAPGAIISGNVTIGQRCFIGAGSLIRQGVTIGDDVTVGIGAVVLNDIPSGVSVMGNPVRMTLPKVIPLEGDEA